jgi:hypothetical protein
MKEQLGWAWWQTLAIYLLPPLLIGLFVIWRAVAKATTHPDQRMMNKERRKRKAEAPDE